MAVMTFGSFISSQFQNMSKMEYKDASSRLVGSAEQKQTETKMNKARSRGRIYYPNLVWEAWLPDIKDIPPLIKQNYTNIFINFFDFPKVIVNPKVYDWFMTNIKGKSLDSFARFLEILTEEGEDQHNEFIKALNEQAGVPTKSVGGGRTSSVFYGNIEDELERGVPLEDIDVLNFVGNVGYSDLPTKLSNIAFKMVEVLGSSIYWEANELNSSWTDAHHWSFYHNDWWFPPNLFVLNVDEGKKYQFINWVKKKPFEVKE
tara:strand:- start:992 stop:1771 length:780 start_codon:yes stop_codon:yes gene_type:complete